MTIRLFDIIVDAGDDAKSKLLKSRTTGLLELIRSKSHDTYQENLAQLIIDFHGEDGILRDKESRQIIFDHLSKDNARRLIEKTKRESTESPHKILRKINFYRNSEDEKVLFDFFGVSLPDVEFIELLENTVFVPTNYPLFSHQRNALIRIESHLNSKENAAILHMPTGSGKTRVAMNSVSRHLLKRAPTLVLWLAYSEELCEQAAEEFQKAWGSMGDRSVILHRFYKNFNWIDEMDDGIIVTGLGKLYNLVKANNTILDHLAKDISLIVFDEAHQASAPTYKLMLDIIRIHNPNTELLGLTATPKSSTTGDVEDLKKIFYGNKVSLEVPGYNNPIEYLISEGYLSEPIYQRLNLSTTNLSEHEKEKILDSLDIPESILDKLSLDDVRNLKIIECVENLIKKGHKRILIFATNVTHAKYLASIIRTLGFESYEITSETPEISRKRVIQKFKEDKTEPIILCNYGVLTTGFDAPKTSAAIIARPTKSTILYSQMVGRAIRGEKVGGTKSAEIWTVVDRDIPGFGDLVESFKEWDEVW